MYQEQTKPYVSEGKKRFPIPAKPVSESGSFPMRFLAGVLGIMFVGALSIAIVQAVFLYKSQADQDVQLASLTAKDLVLMQNITDGDMANMQKVTDLRTDTSNNITMILSEIDSLNMGVNASGTITLIETGTGLTGGPITLMGTINMSDTAVTPGSYTYGSFTVDQQGRLTAASNGVTPVTTDNIGVGLNGNITGSTFNIQLADTTVIPGSYTYASITVDQQGRLTLANDGYDYGPNITQLNIQYDGLVIAINMINHTAITQDLNMSVTELIMNVSMLIATGATVQQVDTGIGLTGGPITTIGTISLTNTTVTPNSYTYASITVNQQGRITAASNGVTPVTIENLGVGLNGNITGSTLNLELADTTVTPGSYTYGAFTVDQQGRLTAASSGTSPVTSVQNGTGLIGGPITGIGTLSLADTAVTPGSYTYSSITVDQQGRLTAASNGATPVTNANIGTGLTGNIAMSTFNIQMADTAVTPGSYTYSAITVDQQGRLTAASSGTTPVTSVDTGTGLTGGPITTTGTISLTNTTVTPGSYTNADITVDAQGRITAAANGASGGTGTVTQVNNGTGLIGGPITTTGTLSLATSGVTAGTYGSATQVPQITVDQYGRATSIVNVALPSYSYVGLQISVLESGTLGGTRRFLEASTSRTTSLSGYTLVNQPNFELIGSPGTYRTLIAGVYLFNLRASIMTAPANEHYDLYVDPSPFVADPGQRVTGSCETLLGLPTCNANAVGTYRLTVGQDVFFRIAPAGLTGATTYTYNGGVVAMYLGP